MSNDEGGRLPPAAVVLLVVWRCEDMRPETPEKEPAWMAVRMKVTEVALNALGSGANESHARSALHLLEELEALRKPRGRPRAFPGGERMWRMLNFMDDQQRDGGLSRKQAKNATLARMAKERHATVDGHRRALNRAINARRKMVASVLMSQATSQDRK